MKHIDEGEGNANISVCINNQKIREEKALADKPDHLLRRSERKMVTGDRDSLY